MRKAIELVLLPALTLFGSFLFSSIGARADDTVVLTEENAIELGIDFQKAKSVLAHAGIEVQDNVIGVKFHEESNEVDLSSFDSISVIVDLSEVARVPDNGVIDGHGG